MEERKKKILRAITDDYITTAEPVGSRTIARRYNLGLSPATIRNEMADLEEGGYLEQPHTSAGRIPSDKGYRFYVDVMLESRTISESEERRIREALDRRRVEFEAIFQHTSRILADLTRCTSLVLGPRLSRSTFKHIELVPLDEENIVVIVVTHPGLVQSRAIRMAHSITRSDLRRISGFLNARLAGLMLADIKSSVLREIHSEFAHYNFFFESVIEVLLNYLEKSGDERVYLDGTANMLEQPEFKDVERLKPVLDALGNEEAILELLEHLVPESGRIAFTIGRENPWREMRGCSMVSASYGIGSQPMGTISVIGPTRMNYTKVVAVVEFVVSALNDVLVDMHTGLRK